MQELIGIQKVEDLFESIPKECRLQGPLISLRLFQSRTCCSIFRPFNPPSIPEKNGRVFWAVGPTITPSPLRWGASFHAPSSIRLTLLTSLRSAREPCRPSSSIRP